MCGCQGNTGKCPEQIKQLERLKVKIKTLQRTTEDRSKRKEYREKYIHTENLINHYKESGECPEPNIINQIKNYTKNEQAKGNK